MQQKSVREKKKFGPTKAEIVTKFLEELKASTGKKKYTLNDLGRNSIDIWYLGYGLAYG